MKKVFIMTFVAAMGISVALKAQTKSAKMTFVNETHDFGTVKEEGGSVTHEFKFTNTGGEPIIIQNVKASCGCTTPEWTKDPVLPGKQGYVRATYDPKNRPGQFNKSITVTSNAENATVILTIKGTVTAKPRTMEDDYPQQMGVLRMKSNHIAFTKILSTEIKTDSLPLVNTGTEPVKVTFESVPEHIKIKIIPETLKPNEKGVIIATYDANKQQDWGFVIDRINVVLNGKFEPNNRLSVSATREEDFSKLTPDQKANAPKVVFESMEFNFGVMNEGEVKDYEFKFTNTGKSDLILRKVKASCGCTAVAPQETVIKPGKSSVIKTSFNSTGKPGKQNKTITVITNDPDNSSITLKVVGDVNKKEGQ